MPSADRYPAIEASPTRVWNDIVEGDGHNLLFTHIAAAQLFIENVAAGNL